MSTALALAPQPDRGTGLSSFEVCRLVGCSYRQLDYWCRRGLVWPAQPARGSGSQRRFDDEDLAVIGALNTLAAMGCEGNRLDRAARSIRAELGGNVTSGWLVVDDEGAAWCSDTDEVAAWLSMSGRGGYVVPLAPPGL